MSKYTPHIIILILGLVLAGFLFRNNLSSFLSPENDFRISDTASVIRIEIFSGDSVILTREGGSWILNGNLPANPVAVNNFLFAFSRMGIRGINNNISIPEDKGIRVKITEGRKRHLLRFYQIEGNAFMHKEGSGKIYSVEVIGFPGVKPGEIIVGGSDHWGDRILLNLRPQDIKEINMIHPQNPESNFTIRNSAGKPVLFDGNGIEVPSDLTNQETMNFYLSYFTNVFYDYSADTADASEKEARWILRLEDTKGKNYELLIFPIKTPEGNDLFKALVRYNAHPVYKVTRFMVLDLLLQDKEHFLVDEFSE